MSDLDLDYYAVQREWLDFKHQYVGRSLFWYRTQVLILMCVYLGFAVSLLALGVALLCTLDAPIDVRIVWGCRSVFFLCTLFCVVRQSGMAEVCEMRLLAVAREAFLGQHTKYRTIPWIRDMVYRRYLT